MGDYVGEFDMVGNLKIGDQIGQTHIRFRNFPDYESSINVIDQVYDSEDALFNGYIYRLDSSEFIKVNRSQYGNGCDFNMKLLNIGEIVVLYQLKDIVLLNVIIS